MKKITIFLVLCMMVLTLSAQENNNSNDSKTKFTEFTSQSGSIMSFEDYSKATFSTFSGALNAKKRIVKKAAEQKLFLVIEVASNYSTRIAAIAEEDFDDLFKAVGALQNDASIDIKSNSDYMEKFYITEDNFKIGYYVSNKQIKWYVNVDTRLPDSTFFIKDFEAFISKIKSIVI